MRIVLGLAPGCCFGSAAAGCLIGAALRGGDRCAALCVCGVVAEASAVVEFVEYSDVLSQSSEWLVIL